ncbi:MAG: alpha/beta fold hydrolase [Thermoflexales bacterium]
MKRVAGVGLVVMLALGAARWAWVARSAPPAEAKPAAAWAEPHSRFLSVGGVALHFTEFGPSDGPAVVLVHGLLGSTADFAELAPTLAAAGFHVLAVDRPPFGLSDKRAVAPMTAAAQADLLAAWLDALGLPQAAWLGHSAGGPVVAHLALRHPERASKLILVAPLLGSPAAGPGNPFTSPALPAVAAIVLSALNPVAPWAEAELRAFFTDEQLRQFLDDQLELARVNEALAVGEARFTRVQGWEAGLRNLGRQILATRDTLQPSHLGELRMPVLLIWGEADRFISPVLGRQLVDAIPTARLVAYPNAGHQPWRDVTADFVRQVVDFLKCSPFTKEAPKTIGFH